MLAASLPRRSSSLLRARPRVSPAARTQIGLFGLAYLLYSAARWVTVGDLPSALKSVVGEGAGYEEKGVLDRASNRYTAEVTPNRLAEKISVRVELSTVADGPNRCKRIAKGSVNVKIFGVGGLLEKKMIGDLEKSYSKSAEFTNEFVKEKNLT